MTPAIEYTLVDENTALTIADGYDPLLKDPFEDYIHITEKVNPGKRRSFNNVPDQETRDVHVSGLVLNWSKDLSRSKLRAVTERESLERLYLYADTIIVNTRLHLPQTHVTIHARRLILGADGTIDTTPNPFANPFAKGPGEPKARKPSVNSNSGLLEINPEDEQWWWGSPPYDDPWIRADPTPLESRHPYPTYRGSDGDSAGDITLFVHTLDVPAGSTCFVLNGSDGQHGEKGGHRDRVAGDDVPVTWDKVLDAVLDFAPVRTFAPESSWVWPSAMKKALQDGQVYYAKVQIHHPDTWAKSKIAYFGSKTLDNQHNGLDAYASGDGGNGGVGGTLRLISAGLPDGCVSQDGGKAGLSEPVAGEPRLKDSTYIRTTYQVAHSRIPNADRLAGTDFGAKELKSRDGYPAKGKDGRPGEPGRVEFLAGQGTRWLHPYILETVVQYSKETWLTGNRRPGKWLLQHYRSAFQKYDTP